MKTPKKTKTKTKRAPKTKKAEAPVGKTAAQYEDRARTIHEHFAAPFHVCDLVMIQVMMRSGGSAVEPREFMKLDPQAAPWGEWMRLAKNAVSANGKDAKLPPLPEFPSWFKSNPAIERLVARARDKTK